MNNGQDATNPPQMGMQLFPANGIVTWEEFQRNLEQIARARETLATIEAQNRASYGRYLEQELHNRVEAGRQAELQLAQLRALQETERAHTSHRSHATAAINQPASQTSRPALSKRNGTRKGTLVDFSTAPLNPQGQQAYYREHIYADTRQPQAAPPNGQMQPPAQTSIPPAFYAPQSVTAATVPVPSTSSRPPVVPYYSHQTHSTTPMSGSMLNATQSQQVQSISKHHIEIAKASGPDHTGSLETGITRAKNTYSSQTSNSKSSVPAGSSAENRAVLEAIAKDVYGTMKSLRPDIVNSVNKMVFEKLRHKLDPSGSVHLGQAPVQSEQVAQLITTLGTYVVSRVQNLPAKDIVSLLKSVTTKISAQNNVTNPTPHENGIGSLASPIIIESNDGSIHSAFGTAALANVSDSTNDLMHSPPVMSGLKNDQPPFAGGAASSLNGPPTHSAPQVSVAATSSADASASQGRKFMPRPPDPSTLARDILRSLGKHRSQELQEDPRKRKRETSTLLTDKKRKTDEDEAVPVELADAHAPSFVGAIVPEASTTARAESTTQQVSVVDQTVPPPVPPPLMPGRTEHDAVPEHVEEIITPGAERTEAENQHEELNKNVRTVNAVLQALSRPQGPETRSPATSPPITATPPLSSQPKAPAHADDVTLLFSASQGVVEDPGVPAAEVDLTMENYGGTASQQQEPETPRQPVASSSKIPLFFPGSPSENDSPPRASALDSDGDVEMEDFVPTGLLGLHRSPTKRGKGKQKAAASSNEVQSTSSPQRAADRWKHNMQVNSDVEVIETSDVDEAKALAPEQTSRGRRHVYVLAPPLSSAAARINARLADRIKEEDGRRAVYLSRPRLSEHRCCWQGCDAVLDSAEKLSLHAQLHAGENEEWNSFTCQWENCREFYSDKKKLATHLKKHSNNILVCAYVGCDHSYATPKDLARHHILEHKGDALKPTTALTTLQVTQLPPLPDELPSYMTVPRRVSKALMSRETHVWLGAKVAANITCYVHPGSRANAAKPSRLTRHVAECIAAVERAAREKGMDSREAVLRMARDEYDAWIEYGSRGPKFCSDLDSAEVTRIVDEGLVLGGTGEPTPVGRSGDLEAREPQVIEEGRTQEIGADGVADAFQAGNSEAHARGADDLSFGDQEMHSTASTEEVAEMARLLVDEQGTSLDEELNKMATGSGSPQDSIPEVGAGDLSIPAPSIPEPGWTTLPEPNEAM